MSFFPPISWMTWCYSVFCPFFFFLRFLINNPPLPPSRRCKVILITAQLTLPSGPLPAVPLRKTWLRSLRFELPFFFVCVCVCCFFFNCEEKFGSCLFFTWFLLDLLHQRWCYVMWNDRWSIFWRGGKTIKACTCFSWSDGSIWNCAKKKNPRLFFFFLQNLENHLFSVKFCTWESNAKYFVSMIFFFTFIFFFWAVWSFLVNIHYMPGVKMPYAS